MINQTQKKVRTLVLLSIVLIALLLISPSVFSGGEITSTSTLYKRTATQEIYKNPDGTFTTIIGNFKFIDDKTKRYPNYVSLTDVVNLSSPEDYLSLKWYDKELNIKLSLKTKQKDSEEIDISDFKKDLPDLIYSKTINKSKEQYKFAYNLKDKRNNKLGLESFYISIENSTKMNITFLNNKFYLEDGLIIDLSDLIYNNYSITKIDDKKIEVKADTTKDSKKTLDSAEIDLDPTITLQTANTENLKDATVLGASFSPELYSDANFGTATTLITKNDSQALPSASERVYLSFNTSILNLQKIIIINSASLILTGQGSYNFGGQVAVHHVYNDWLNGTGNNRLSETQITFNNQPCGKDFYAITNSSNCNLTSADKINVSGESGASNTWNVTSIFQKDFGKNNISFVLVPTTADLRNSYASKEYSTSSYRPKLTITYTPYINIISPTPSQIFTQDSPTAYLNISTAVNMTTCYYNNGSTNFTMASVNSTYFYNDTAGSQYLDGSAHKVTFWCNQSDDGTWRTSETIDFEVDPINITRCRDLTIKYVSREYQLLNDLSSSDAASCIYIKGDQVTIKGNNHKISNMVSAGINQISGITSTYHYISDITLTGNAYGLAQQVSLTTINLTNSNISGNTKDFFNSFSSMTINAINVTENTEDLDGTLNRIWYFFSTINNSVGNLANANISIYNITGGLIYSALTNSTGQIPRQELLEYKNIAGTVSFNSPYTINVSKAGYTTNSTTYNLTTTKNVDHLVILDYSDTTPPYFTTIPANLTINYTQGFGVDFDAADETAFDSYAINWTTLFTINQSGYLTNSTPNLAVGTYLINVTINDSVNNKNSTIWKLIVNQAVGQVSLLLNNTANNITLNVLGQVNASAYSTTGTITLYRNGADVTGEMSTFVSLGVGYYNYTAYSTNANYTTVSTTLFANITSLLNFTILYPVNLSYLNYNVSIPLNLSITNYTALSSCIYSFDNFATNISFTCVNTTFNKANGNWLMKVWMKDTNVGSNTSSVNFTIDTLVPGIKFISPTELTNSVRPQNWTYINLQVIEANVVNITYNLYNASYSLLNSTNSLNTYFNFTSLVDGVYYYNATIIDKVGLTNQTETRKITLQSAAPSVAIVYPQSINYNYIVTDLNYTTTGALDTCKYTLDDGATNTTITCGTNVTGLTAPQGTSTWKIYINDTVGVEYFAYATFLVDTIYPTINYGSGTPTEGANLSQNSLYIDTTWTEANIQNITFRINSSTEITYASATDHNFTGLTSGIYYINVTICDVVNQCNTTSTRTVTLDTISPTGTLNTPLNGTYTQTSSQNLSVNLTDNLGIKNATLYVYNQSGFYNSTTQTFPANTLTSTLGIVINLVENVYNWFYTIFDWSGNTYTTGNNTISIDQTKPLITIYSPLNTTYLTDTIVLSFITTDNSPVNSTSYSLNGATNVTVTNGTSIDMLHGSNTLIFYAQDKAGNENSSSVTFYVNYTDKIDINSLTSSPAYPTYNEQFTLLTNISSYNVEATCNFTLTNPLGATIINNTNGTYTGGLWVTSAQTANLSGQWNYTANCTNILGTKNSSSGSFIVPAYVLSYYPTNDTFAARENRNETKSFMIYVWDNSNATITIYLNASISPVANFTISTNPTPTITLNASDSITNPFTINVTFQANETIADGFYYGFVSLNETTSSTLSYFNLTYGIKPPAGVPNIYTILGELCRYSFGSNCSSSFSMVQGTTYTLNYQVKNDGGFNMSECSLVSSQSWKTYSASNFNLTINETKTVSMTYSSSGVSPGVYWDQTYLQCNKGDALNSVVTTTPINRILTQITVTGAATLPPGGGGTPELPTGNKTFCGDGVCQSTGNDYGIKENFFNCEQDCQGFNLDSITLNCFSKDPVKRANCVWNQNLGALIGFILIFVIFIISLAKIKTSSGEKVSVAKYLYGSISKKWRGRK